MFELPHAKGVLMTKIIKIEFLTDYDRLQFKFTEKDIWVRYQAYLLRYRSVMVKDHGVKKR